MAGTGASGRRPKATQAHVLAGTFRNDRHGDHESPEAPKGQPEPPKPLEGDALEEWHRMVGRMAQMGTSSIVDDAWIYQYCLLFAETEALVVEKAEAKAAADRLDESYGDIEPADRMAFFQEVGKMRKLAASYDAKIRSNRMALRQYLAESGMTPASRGRVKLPPKKQESKLDRFMPKASA